MPNDSFFIYFPFILHCFLKHFSLIDSLFLNFKICNYISFIVFLSKFSLLWYFVKFWLFLSSYFYNAFISPHRLVRCEHLLNRFYLFLDFLNIFLIQLWVMFLYFIFSLQQQNFIFFLLFFYFIQSNYPNYEANLI